MKPPFHNRDFSSYPARIAYPRPLESNDHPVAGGASGRDALGASPFGHAPYTGVRAPVGRNSEGGCAIRSERWRHDLGIGVLVTTLVTLALVATGCTPATSSRESHPVPVAIPDATEYRAEGILLRLAGMRRSGDAGSLIKDPGWVEYILAVDNTGPRPLTIHNVKLLNRNGRYLDSAGTYGQVTSPPDVASDIAGSLATSAAGVAAGQVIPYGGTIVGIISKAASASSVESEAGAKREFNLRKLKQVELAPGGRMIGSTFLPDVIDAKVLVVDYGYDESRERIEIPVPRS